MEDLQSILLPGIDSKRPIIIAGPCSAETEEQVMTTAKSLAERGIKIFRAGIWKPRTKPGGFEGIGVEGLAWLKHVKEETGMYTATEVATERHVFEALKHGIDILWIGARTTANPFAVQEIANALKGVDIPVLIKNPVNPDLELWIGAVERIYNAGLHRLAVIHRGFSSYDKQLYRNMPQWHIPIELRRRLPNLPIFCDPSHIGGKRELVAPLSQQAMDLGFDGLIVESHCDPDCAWSDKNQQVTPDALDYILNMLVIRETTQTTENLSELRHQIDNLDNQLLELLAKRMRISREIGQYKKEHSMPVLQTGSFFADVLSFDHEIALYDIDPYRLRFAFNTLRMTRPEEIQDFTPDLVINAATVKYTIEAFQTVLPYLPAHTILSDIASVKTGLPEFYAQARHPFVSTHPMFGPTFANLSDLSTQNTIIITEGDHMGKIFFKDIYQRLRLNIFEYSFKEHDETIAYSLSVPFTSTLVFASIMKHQEAPGTTFKKHMDIARGLLSEDDYLLTEILFNPNTPDQVRGIQKQLSSLLDIIERKDSIKMKEYLTQVRKNIE